MKAVLTHGKRSGVCSFSRYPPGVCLGLPSGNEIDTLLQPSHCVGRVGSGGLVERARLNRAPRLCPQWELFHTVLWSRASELGRDKPPALALVLV